MTQAEAGYSTLLQIGDRLSPESFMTIAEVEDMSGPGMGLDTPDVTHHISAGAFDEGVAALLEGGEIDFFVNYRPTQWTHKLITGVLEDLRNRTRRNFRLIFPDVGETMWAFSAYVIGFEPDEPDDDKLTAVITLLVSGSAIEGSTAVGGVTYPISVFCAPKWGVYFTSDFPGPDDLAAQPTWQDIRSGLPTLSSGERGIKVFDVDPFSKLRRQFCLTVGSYTSDINGIVHRREGGVWKDVLTQAQARTIMGGNGKLRWIATDSENEGRLWALYVDDAVSVKLMGSDNWGDTWTRFHTLYTGIHKTGVRNLRVRGNTFYVGGVASGRGGVFFNIAGGGWNIIDPLGESMLYLGPMDPVDPTRVYVISYDYADAILGVYDLARLDLGSMLTLLRDADNLGVNHMVDALWVYGGNPDWQKMVRAGVLKTTRNGWATVASATTLNWALDSVVVPVVNDPTLDNLGYMIMGQDYVTSQEHHTVCVVNGDDSPTAIGKAGIMPVTPPYTNSIPYTTGGICQGGAIQVVV